MNEYWEEFCKKENDRRKKEMIEKIEELKKETDGKKIENFKIGKYQTGKYSCY